MAETVAQLVWLVPLMWMIASFRMRRKVDKHLAEGIEGRRPISL